MSNEKTNLIDLPSGSKATLLPFKGKHVVEAQKLIGENAEKMMMAIVSLCVLIDGKPILMEDLEEMSGADVLKLIGQFGGENF